MAKKDKNYCDKLSICGNIFVVMAKEEICTCGIDAYYPHGAFVSLGQANSYILDKELVGADIRKVELYSIFVPNGATARIISQDSLTHKTEVG